ncbi:hypothetical protein ACF08M_08765 [Streptomyces sp. NPDC015032]|uniref:hypothetical protein n=1 Tax=Streptomyces sp. NPDC015032 TaxID=3364937 RepID=UPI0036FB4B73
MRRAYRLLTGLLLAGALLTATAGCAQSVDPIERLGRKAAQKMTHPRPAPAAGPQARPHGGHGAHGDHGGHGNHGDHGAPGSPGVIVCGRPPESGHSSSSPPLRHWWPDRPGPSEGVAPGAGCERR